MQGRFFEDEIRPHLKHKKRGLLGMAGAWPACGRAQARRGRHVGRRQALHPIPTLPPPASPPPRTCCAGAGEDMNGSQFYITTSDSLDSLDEKVGSAPPPCAACSHPAMPGLGLGLAQG